MISFKNVWGMAGLLSMNNNTESWLVEAQEVFSYMSVTFQIGIPTIKLAFRDQFKIYKDYTPGRSNGWTIISASI